MGFDERMRPHATMGPIHDETSRPTIICACYWSVRVIVRKASNNNNNFFMKTKLTQPIFLRIVLEKEQECVRFILFCMEFECMLQSMYKNCSPSHRTRSICYCDIYRKQKLHLTSCLYACINISYQLLCLAWTAQRKRCLFFCFLLYEIFNRFSETS